MRFGRAHKLITYTFATLGLLALVQGSSFGSAFTAAVGVAVLASWFAERPFIASAGYSRFWTYLTVGGLLVQVLRALAGEPALNVGIEFAAFLQLSRLAHRKTAADYQQIVILGFLHLIAGTVLSSGLEYAGIFVGFVVIMPWMLALTHLRVEMERQHGVATEAFQNELHSSQHATAGFFGGTLLLTIPLFAVTAAFFFAFPRVGFGFFSQFGQRMQSVAGFGDDVELGGFGTIRDDPTVIMRVKPVRLEDPPPSALTIRLRGTSFDTYELGRWSRSPARAIPISRDESDYALIRDKARTDTSYQIILDPMDEAVLFLPQGVVALTVPPNVESGRRRYKKLRYSPGLDVRYQGVLSGPLSYTAHVDPRRVSFGEPISKRQIKKYLAVPDDYERVAALAKNVAGAETDPMAIATRVEDYLRRKGQFKYTLKQPDVGDADPLHVFLFDAKAGHCEYFSTAMAIMLRTLNIPTRNVTGFVGADFNPYGGYYAVRNGNAHSWVEAKIGDQWHTFDPTPSGASTASKRTWLDQARQVVDAMRVRWAQYIVEYNVRDQARALTRAMGWLRSMRKPDKARAKNLQLDEEDASERLRDWAVKPDWRLFAAIMFVFGILVVLNRLWQRRRRNASAGRRLDGRRDRALKLYLELENSLRRAGRPRPPDATPREHAESLVGSDFEDADDVLSVTDAYLEVRFGTADIEPERLAHLKQMAKRVGKGPKPSQRS